MRGPRGLVAAAPFMVSIVVAAAAACLEAAGQSRLWGPEARAHDREKGVDMSRAVEAQDPREVEAALDLLPFDAHPRRWLARIHARDGASLDEEGPLARAIAEGLDRRPRDPVLLFLAGEEALRAGDDATADRLREAAVRVGAYEHWMIDRFARERLETGRAREAAAADFLESARGLEEASDAEGAAALRERAARERAGAKRALEAVVRVRAELTVDVRKQTSIDGLSAEAEGDLADLERAR